MTTVRENLKVTPKYREISHLLRRAGFGATPGEMDRYIEMDYSEVVDELLNAPGTSTMPDDVIFRMFPEYHASLGVDACANWAYRMVSTDSPLEEKITLFWHGIFATGNDKLNNPLVLLNQIDTFRRNGMGRFDDILLDLSRDPAMLIWLDNQTNHKDSINENYGREILELFSMGVGNYTEDDIKECARAFTGWSVKNAEYMALMGQKDSIWPYSRISWHYEYRQNDHDDTEKTFLGEKGKFDGEDIIEIICRQESTARFISRHLYNFFVEDEVQVPSWQDVPPKNPKAIGILTDAYFEHGHDLKKVLKELFESDFFKESEYIKVKGPAEMVINVLRLSGGFEEPTLSMIQAVEEAGYMGQLLFYPPSVEGWHTGQEWITSGSVLDRVNFSSARLTDLSSPGIRDILNRIGNRCGTNAKPEYVIQNFLELMGIIEISDATFDLLMEVCDAKDSTVDTTAVSFDVTASNILRVIGASKEFHLV